MWTVIWSLRREDAARLGYEHADAWHTLLLAKQTELAKAFGIPPQQLRWYAAFHDAGHHPSYPCNDLVYWALYKDF